MNDDLMREKATELGRQIRGEPDGVTVAVRLIEEAVCGTGGQVER